MNVIQDINQLRKAGRLDEAFQLNAQLLEASPANRPGRVAMAWCLKDMYEAACARLDVNAVVDILQRLRQLNLPQINELGMHNRFIWDLFTLFESIAEHRPQILFAVADRVFNALKALDFERPNKYYSKLVEIMSKLRSPQGAPWPRFVEFMDWFGFDNLTDDDYARVSIADGRTLPAVAERAFSSYHKTLMALIDARRVDAARVEAFIEQLTRLNAAHPEYQFTLYRKALLLLALGRKQQALEAIRPFVKRRQSEFWVWDVLSDTLDEPSVRLSCLSRALTCHADAQFLSRVRFKAAQLMHQLGFDANARAEIRLMHQVYQANGWHTPPKVADMVRQPWYQAAQAPESNATFYRDHLAESESLLYLDDPQVPILITMVIPDKKVCRFITADGRRSFFSTKRTKGAFAANEVHLVRFEGEVKDDTIATVLTHQRARDLTPYLDIFFQKIDGPLRRLPGRAYAFVGDIFVPADIAADLPAGTPVTGTAVKTYSSKRQTWSWQALTLRRHTLPE